jgi:hypothetical protein
MATTEQIFNDIAAAHDKEELIKKIPVRATSDSVGAIYRAVAAGMKTIYDAIDSFKVYFEQTRFSAVAPSNAWLSYTATQYQHSDKLFFKNGSMQYNSQNTALQIVKVANTYSFNGQTYLKACKVDDDGVLIPLSETERAGLESYMKQKKPADMYLIVSSNQADVIIFKATIYIDATKLSINGTALYDNNILPVNDSINAMLSNYSNINTFNSELSLTQFENAIRAVDGVKNAFITEFTVDSINVLAIPSRTIIPKSGYFTCDFGNVNTVMTFIAS